jgi:hypothetical protein
MVPDIQDDQGPSDILGYVMDAGGACVAVEDEKAETELV